MITKVAAYTWAEIGLSTARARAEYGIAEFKSRQRARENEYYEDYLRRLLEE